MIRLIPRLLSVALAAALILCAVGCTEPAPPVSTPTVNPDPPYQITDPTRIPSNPTRPTQPIQSFTELSMEQLRLPGYDQGWISRFHMVFGQEFLAVSDEQALKDALNKLDISEALSGIYDHQFFVNNRLVLIPMQSGSGSVRYYAEASTDSGQIEITVGTLPMEVGTSDMADWLLLIPLSRGQFPEKQAIVVDLPAKIDRNEDLPVYDH